MAGTEIAALDQDLAQGDRVIQGVPHDPRVAIEGEPLEHIARAERERGKSLPEDLNLAKDPRLAGSWRIF